MTNIVKPLSRKQLQSFLPTQEAVIAFEELFRIASTLSPQSYDNIVAAITNLNNEVAALNNQIVVIQNNISTLQTQIGSIVEITEMLQIEHKREA